MHVTVEDMVAEGDKVVFRATNSGIFIEKGHELEGQKVTGRVLVFPRGKGSTTAPYVLYSSAKRGNSPIAIINIEADAIVAVAAVMSDIPLEVINNGDWVTVDADKGVVNITTGKSKT